MSATKRVILGAMLTLADMGMHGSTPAKDQHGLTQKEMNCREEARQLRQDQVKFNNERKKIERGRKKKERLASRDK